MRPLLKIAALAAAGTAAGGLAVLVAGTIRSARMLDYLWSDLRFAGTGEPFDTVMVTGLPEPARRFLLHAIAPGTPLARSVELTMRGAIRLSPDGAFMPFRAEQVLAPPNGFIWRAHTGTGALRIAGHDRYVHGAGGMRWALYGIVPVMRATGADVTRSAAGRLGLEAILLPSSLLPGRGAMWAPVDGSRAQFRFRIGTEEVVALLEVHSDGRPRRVSAHRWSPDAGPAYDTFVVEFDGEVQWDGYTLPARIEAGWRLGDADEFRFFRATLATASFR